MDNSERQQRTSRKEYRNPVIRKSSTEEAYLSLIHSMCNLVDQKIPGVKGPKVG